MILTATVDSLRREPLIDNVPCRSFQSRARHCRFAGLFLVGTRVRRIARPLHGLQNSQTLAASQ